jgi:uncharacterized membrane protein
VETSIVAQGMNRQRTDQPRSDRRARALGWFSLGLGTAQLLFPRAVSRLCGVDDSLVAPAVMRVVGVRELGSAAALLGTKKPGPWTWTRVAGDVMDLAMLGWAVSRRAGARRRRAAVTTAAVAGLTALDQLTAQRSTGGTRSTLHVEASITVNRPPEEVYRFWREVEKLPDFMYHLESVRVNGARTSHWTAKAPAGRTVEWDAEIVEDVPNELIRWRSAPGARVKNAGVVRFATAPGGRGTEVRVELAYMPPAGALGAAVAKLFGEEPEQQVRDDLRRFKQVIETGEIVRSEGSPLGTSARQMLRQHAAQPLRADEAADQKLVSTR